MWKGLRAKREEGWLSIVPCGDRIDLAHVIRSAGKLPEVRRFESYRREGSVGETLSRLVDGKGLKRFALTTLLDDGAYRLASVESPSVPAEERNQALRWGLREIVDVPIESAVIAAVDIPGNPGRQPQVLAVVAPRERVAERMAAFQKASLGLEAIDIPEMAVRNVAALFEEPKRGLAFVSISEGGTSFIVTYLGELVISRRIEVSSQSLHEADVERRHQMLERLALELQRTLDNFDRQYGFISVAQLRVAAEHDCAGIVSALAENLYLPVKAADLAQVMTFPGVPELAVPERQAQGLLAIGAALREKA